MKRVIFLLAVAAAALSCAREKVIPDEELAQIFRDAYLINAYADDRRLRFDSLELYEPVFERYGYTARNVRYTIGNFSRRKSAKLGDVVERAIQMLEQEGRYYRREVAVLDTIDNVARRRYARTLHSDTLIRVSRLRDTTRLHFRFEDIHAGEYRISYEYLIDSLDKTPLPRARMWIEGTEKGIRKELSNLILRKFHRETITRTLQADTSARTLVLDLYYSDRDRLERPDITLYDLKVSYTPALSMAVDSLFHDQLPLRLFADEFFAAFAPDSVQLSLRTDGDR